MAPIGQTFLELIKSTPMARMSTVANTLICLLNKKYVAGFFHQDMHVGNLCVLNDGNTLGFIDFGLSSFVPTTNAQFRLILLDFIPLVSSFTVKSSNADLVAKYKLLNQNLVLFYQNYYNMTVCLDRFNRIPTNFPAGGGEAYNLFPEKQLNAKDVYVHSYKSIDSTHCSMEQFDRFFPHITLPSLV